MNVRLARRMLDSGAFAPEHTAELACALAMLELKNGDRRKARKLFQKGLVRPNENALAQATWASTEVRGLGLPIEHPVGIARAFEAHAREAYHAHQLPEALAAATFWLFDEPFSVEPAVLGSYIASVGLEDHETAVHLCRAALPANSEDPTLLNNLAFSLASQGDISSAQHVLKRAIRLSANGSERIALTATAGLVAYRSGAFDLGRMLYQTAIEAASGSEYKEQRAMALLYRTRDEMRIGSPDAAGLLAEAEAAWKLIDPTSLPIVRDILRRLADLQKNGASDLPK
ncbi:MAG: hypothetical protein M3506_08905 [Chloroflexota bacterium]|nr:hypothetical protein [Chloroflexota bacterium]